MILSSIVIAGGTVIVGTLGASLNVYRKNKRKRERLWAFSRKRMDESKQASGTRKPSYGKEEGSEFIADLKKFSREEIKPLFTDPRHQQLLDISSEEDEVEINEAEKEANRYLMVSTTALALTTTGGLFYAPLSLLSVPALTYVTWGVLQRSYRYITEDGMIAIPLLDSIFNVGLILTGHYFTLSLVSSFYYINQKLLAKTQENGRKKLINVFDFDSPVISILSDGVEKQIEFDALEVGQTVVVHAGQRIPVDGTISEGYASIDQAILTGESQPVEKEVDDDVFASTVVLNGKICVESKKVGQDTIAVQIGEILSGTADFKTSLQSRGEKISNQGAMPTLLLSGLTLPWLGSTSALAILSTGFGYHMRTIAPLSVLNFLRIASLDGILIKDGRSMELLSEVDTIVFDKTGTLTEEQPSVGQIYVNDNEGAPVPALVPEVEGQESPVKEQELGAIKKENELLRLAAAAERKQSHPIARALRKEAKRRQLDLPPIGEANIEIGYGIQVEVEEQSIRLGSLRFLESEEIPIPNEYQQIEKDAHEEGYSLVYVAINNQLGGAIELRPTIRPEAKRIISQLRKRKISMVIISGDHEKPTQKLAEEVGIEQYFAQTLPENKASLVEALQKEGKTVCFVGDGINDSIALKKANVSISLRGASTVATDTAAIILMDQSLKQLPKLLDIAHRFENNMQTNLIISTVPSLFAVGGIFFLHFGVLGTIILYDVGLILGLLNAISPLLNARRKEK